MTRDELVAQAMALPLSEIAAIIHRCLEIMGQRGEHSSLPMPVFSYVVVADNATGSPLASATDAVVAARVQRAIGMTGRSTIVSTEEFFSKREPACR